MRKRRFQALPFLVALLLLPACDFLGEDETARFDKEVEFRFEFSTDGDVGEAVTTQSMSTVDIEDELFAEGYSREEVASATIRSVTVERLQPVGTGLNVFDEMELSLTASGVNVPTHARTDDLPSSSSVQLDVAAAAVTAVVREPAFGARLTVVPTIEEDFVLEASVNLSIDVEGI